MNLQDLKVTKTNFLPTTELGKVPVYGDYLNKIIDWFTTNLVPEAGTGYIETLVELTPGTGITIDGTLIKDGGVQLDKGTVNQETAITTGVTINKPSGVITTVSSTLAAGSNASFTVTNSFCKSTSTILLTPDDSLTAGLAKLNVQTLTDGTFDINITNIHGANAFNNKVKIHYTIL